MQLAVSSFSPFIQCDQFSITMVTTGRKNLARPNSARTANPNCFPHEGPRHRFTTPRTDPVLTPVRTGTRRSVRLCTRSSLDARSAPGGWVNRGRAGHPAAGARTAPRWCHPRASPAARQSPRSCLGQTVAGTDPPLPEVRNCRLGMPTIVICTLGVRRLKARLGIARPD